MNIETPRSKRTVDGFRPSSLLALLVVLAIRVLFVVTYPLNDFGGDAHNYETMLLEGNSSLVHAGGYPFLFGLPFRIHGVQDLLSGSFPYVVLVAQHAMDMLALFFLYRITSQLFGHAAGVLTLLLQGFSIQGLTATSSTYPEWLQADLFILALGCTYYAWAHETFRGKLWFYACGTFAFSWCTLVKFNIAVLGVVLLVALALDAVDLKRKATIAGVCVLVVIATFVPYLRMYQYRTTGAYALTYDTAWVLLTRVQGIFHNTLNPKAGLATRRWLALSSVLPRSYEVAGPGLFSHVDAVPDAIRAPYRARFGYLLKASDEETRSILVRHSLPDGFSVGLSPIPIAYYLGLAESDHLGVRVAVEAIRAHPAVYLDGVCREVLAVVRYWPHDEPFASSSGLTAFGATIAAPMPLGFVKVNQRRDYPNVPFSFSVPVLWWPGVRLFSALNDYGLPPYWPSLAVGIAILLAIVRIAVLRRVDLQASTTLLLAAMVCMMVVVSVATLAFRWKEARVALPLVSVLAGGALSHAMVAARSCRSPVKNGVRSIA